MEKAPAQEKSTTANDTAVFGVSGTPAEKDKNAIVPKGTGLQPETDSQPEGAAKKVVNNRRTALHVTLNEQWGAHWIADAYFEQLLENANPEKSGKSKTGFWLTLNNGSDIEWRKPTQRYPEMITGNAKKFDQSAADAIVTLSRIRGWSNIDVHGTVEQKEMLWLAVQVQNLREKKAFDESAEQRNKEDKARFEKAQAAGDIPREKDGKPVEFEPAKFVPSKVTNFAPLADSAIWLKLREAEEKYRITEKPADNAPRVTKSEQSPAPETAAPAIPSPESKFVKTGTAGKKQAVPNTLVKNDVIEVEVISQTVVEKSQFLVKDKPATKEPKALADAPKRKLLNPPSMT